MIINFFQVNLFKDYIARAFPDGDDLILDSEVLMVDNETGQPLPFGTLGIHKVKVISLTWLIFYFHDMNIFNIIFSLNIFMFNLLLFRILSHQYCVRVNITRFILIIISK